MSPVRLKFFGIVWEEKRKQQKHVFKNDDEVFCFGKRQNAPSASTCQKRAPMTPFTLQVSHHECCTRLMSGKAKCECIRDTLEISGEPSGQFTERPQQNPEAHQWSTAGSPSESCEDWRGRRPIRSPSGRSYLLCGDNLEHRWLDGRRWSLEPFDLAAFLLKWVLSGNQKC